MEINGVKIAAEFAEAFDMTATRIIVTADSAQWVKIAATTMTGFATSVIACGVEAGIERYFLPTETPDGRHGAAILLFGFSRDSLVEPVRNRVSQCVLTCPGTACFAGVTADGIKGSAIPLGRSLRYFGDGFQTAKRLLMSPPERQSGAAIERRFWRIPVMDGEFLCEDMLGHVSAIGGGNFLILGQSRRQALLAAEAAIVAMRKIPEVIMPFPGGVVRSGSKVGSRYPALMASTNQAYCPTLVGIAETSLVEGTAAVYEIVIDGLNFAAIAEATRVGIIAACHAPEGGILAISAGNYGGNLGRHHFKLHEILADAGGVK
ncbi:MAG: formylmethanofuran--tetrahydromethanopterin N-formyltransferase [Candidatus Pacebacteria bacterium]|nr:formylmethanofuran--tetrahydromethanopterin N-formyltransferase [Candidatus Paceibacterota bacterium]